MAKSKASISSVVRRALIQSKASQAEIARATGVDAPGLFRFRLGGQLRSDRLDRLAEFLGIEAVERPTKKGRQR